MTLQTHPNQLFCVLRREWIRASPEEQVRQLWIHHLTQNLGYPIATMVVEKSLHQMPHLSQTPLRLPQRRADLIIFAKEIHPLYPLYPLLLIECKATSLTPKAMQQVMGYNFYLKAPFIAIVNKTEARLGWIDPNQKQLSTLNGIPSYSQLLHTYKVTSF